MSNPYLPIYITGAIPVVVYLIAAAFLPKLKGRRLLFVSALILVSVVISTLFSMFVTNESVGDEGGKAANVLAAALWRTAFVVVLVVGTTYCVFVRAKTANMQFQRQSWWANAAYMVMVLWLLIPKFTEAYAVYLLPKGYLLLPGFLVLLFAIIYLFHIWRREGNLCPVPSNSASAFFRKAALVLMALVGTVFLAVIAATGFMLVTPNAALGLIVGWIGGSVVVSLLCWGALASFEIARWFSFSREPGV